MLQIIFIKLQLIIFVTPIRSRILPFFYRQKTFSFWTDFALHKPGGGNPSFSNCWAHHDPISTPSSCLKAGNMVPFLEGLKPCKHCNISIRLIWGLDLYFGYLLVCLFYNPQMDPNDGKSVWHACDDLVGLPNFCMSVALCYFLLLLLDIICISVNSRDIVLPSTIMTFFCSDSWAQWWFETHILSCMRILWDFSPHIAMRRQSTWTLQRLHRQLKAPFYASVSIMECICTRWPPFQL